MNASRVHLVRAPSNIALIKYMGKSDPVANLPENPSLSMTLESLATWMSIEEGATSSEGFRIAPESPVGASASARAPELSSSGIEKVLRHCARVRSAAPGLLPEHGLGLRAGSGWVLRTGNTFPQSSGIASSASSFAALTLAVALACAADPEAFAKTFRENLTFRRALARLSRLGSGSSCRSFEGPWVLWQGQEVTPVAANLPALSHFVLVISAAAKTVPSSDAHARVKSSPLWSGRVERVGIRLEMMSAALERGDLPKVARLAWTEAWEMHSLFHTSTEPFSYWKPETIAALHWLAPYLTSDAPPIVTLDAGPNIHVIVPRAAAPVWRERFVVRYGAESVLEDRPGTGAEVVS